MNKEWNNESENKPRVPTKDEARKIKFRGSYSGVDDELNSCGHTTQIFLG